MVFSCIPHRKLLYLKLEQGNNPIVESFKRDTTFQYRVQPGDVISIEISSTVASQMELFNQKFEDKQAESSNPELNGYLIGKDGNIDLPLAGIIHVDSMTVTQINEAVKSRLKEYIDYAYVKTRLASFSITILGEVKSPGVKVISNENINILQALGIAGDLIETGNRKKVRIIRKEWNKNKVITLDISDKKLISSEYYYLMPNDIVYVEPLKVKALRINIPTISLVTSTLALLLLIYRTTR